MKLVTIPYSGFYGAEASWKWPIKPLSVTIPYSGFYGAELRGPLKTGNPYVFPLSELFFENRIKLILRFLKYFSFLPSFSYSFLLPFLKIGNRNDASVFHTTEASTSAYVVGKVYERYAEVCTCFANATQCQSVE